MWIALGAGGARDPALIVKLCVPTGRSMMSGRAIVFLRRR